MQKSLDFEMEKCPKVLSFGKNMLELRGQSLGEKITLSLVKANVENESVLMPLFTFRW